MDTVEKLSKELADIASEALEQVELVYSANKEMPAREILRAAVTQRLINSLDSVIDRTVKDLLRQKIQAHAGEVVDKIFSAWVRDGEIHLSEVPESTREFMQNEVRRIGSTYGDHNISAPERMAAVIFRATARGEKLSDVANALDIPLSQAKALNRRAKQAAADVKAQYQVWFGPTEVGDL